MEELTLDQTLQIAVRHYAARRMQPAEQICRLILAKQPNHADALNLLGVLASNRGQNEIALELVRRAIALNPSSAEYHSNLGNLLRAAGQPAAAIDAYGKAIEIKPGLADVHNNLGCALTDRGELEEAIACHRTAIRLNPNLPEAHSNLGNVLTDLGKLDDAIDAYRAALILAPDHAEVHLNLGMCLLLKGDYSAGWGEYEWRLKSEADPGLLQPMWDGSELRGRTILLRGEQGLGDTIQFIRYVPLVARRGGRVIVQCHQELIGLLRQTAPVAEWISFDQPVPRYDVWRPLLSLPMLFETTVDSVPPQDPPLQASENLKFDFRARLERYPLGLKVGLVWAGRTEHRNDRNRSIALSQLARLAKVPNTLFVSLQKGAAVGQIAAARPGFDLVDLTEHLNDFADTAALMSNLDLVISVDTSVSHLAGAMGKPVWLLVPFAPDWRWMTGRGDSPWYPTMRLFRQTRIGDWAGVVDGVAEELSRAVP